MISRELHPKIGVHLQVIELLQVTSIFHLISRVFRPFLSQRLLISRRLQRKQGLNKTQKAAIRQVQGKRRWPYHCQDSTQVIDFPLIRADLYTLLQWVG
jgi:hypothetical protein